MTQRKDGTRKYGNTGISYRLMSNASGCTEYKIMSYVKILEPFMEMVEND